MATLLERMAAIRENANTSVHSEATNSTPLEDYIRLYNKSKGECYTEYMKGAKALHEFLSPIDIPSEGVAVQPRPLACLFHGYEVQQLANIISGETFGTKHNYATNLILYYTAKHILEEVTDGS